MTKHALLISLLLLLLLILLVVVEISLLLLLLYLLFCSCSRHPVHPGGPGTYDDLPVPFLGPKSGTIVFCPSAATATNTSPVAA